MGIAAAVLLYDLTARRFGRAAGLVAGFALATTPIIVAVSRHNNPDELLILCCVAAMWCGLRALESGRTRWLVWSAVCVGLGFETKMLVAMMVVPGLVLAWLWSAPVGVGARVRRLIVASAAGLAVALAWPLLVMLTPAADRPWVSGTADNSIWSLIFGYNGVGRVAGQSGGPGGGARRRVRRRCVRWRHRSLPAVAIGPRRSGRMAARLRHRGGPRPRRADAAAPPRSADRLADGDRRRARRLGGRVQLRPGDLPPLLRVLLRPLCGRPGRRGHRHDAPRP